jgi:hypothetical protein
MKAKQKQILNLESNLAAKANDNEVLKISNNLEELNPATARTNLAVYSKTEIDNFMGGVENTTTIDTPDEFGSLPSYKVGNRVFVINDGDGKWALYIITYTDGTAENTTFEKISDQDLMMNALSAAQIKSAYESNSNTNALTDTLLQKLQYITISSALNLNTMNLTIGSNTNAASNAQSKADSAYSLANSKMAKFEETKDTFSTETHEAEVPFDIVLSKNILGNTIPQAFLNGFLIDNLTIMNASTVRLVADYHIEAGDVLVIYFKTPASA